MTDLDHGALAIYAGYYTTGQMKRLISMVYSAQEAVAWYQRNAQYLPPGADLDMLNYIAIMRLEG